MEYCQTTENELITAVNVEHGAYVDGSEFNKLYNQTIKSRLRIEELLGDKAYFKIGIIEKLEEEKIKAYIPVSACSYRVNEELYSYNKDSDQWFCKGGNETIRKRDTSTETRKTVTYYFEKNTCKTCPYRAECIGNQKRVAKQMKISVNAPKYYEYSQFNKTEEYQTNYKKRARIEGKNAEMKRFHGLARARGYGLKSVEIQAKLTAIAVDLKKIGKLFSLKIYYYLLKFNNFILRKYKKQKSFKIYELNDFFI